MICWVIRNGVPFDVAYALDEAELIAYAITFSSIETNKEFDWENMSFPER
jgi:hypothetical protein